MKIVKLFIIGLSVVAMAACNTKPVETEKEMKYENETIETIMERRSIRKYKPEIVARETLEKIMECGINAPNGQNKQSWEVRVVDNPAVMDEIKAVMAEAYGDKAEMAVGCFRGAPVMVFIARDLNYDFSAYDCGLLAENIMLSAQSLGVGSICLGSPVRIINDNEACAPILERLGFSEDYEFCLCVGLGYADEAPEAKPRDKSKVLFVE
jgi:nitroreductase